MDPRLGTAIVVVVGVPAVLIGYIWLTEQLLRAFGQRIRPKLRPWRWLAPALAFLGVFLVYPTLGTIVRSFENKAGTASDHFGVVLQKGNPLAACVNKAITTLRANGTLKKLQQTWLAKATGAPILK
jgi:uncharacterized membrane protein (DUF485 family)